MSYTEKLNRIFSNESPELDRFWDALTDHYPNIPYDTIFCDNTEAQNHYIYVCMRGFGDGKFDINLDELAGESGNDQNKVWTALSNIQNKDIRMVLTHLMNK